MDNFPDYKSVEEILDIAKKASNHRISDFNVNNRSLKKSNKGVIGQIIEEGVFHYPVNSRAEADFAKLGVELKVTGLKKLKNNSYVAKERLVLNIINFMSEYRVSFEESSFWKKNKELLLVFYLYDENSADYNFLLIDSILHKFSKEDLLIIKKDWETIANKINEGKADEISEANTMYLAACTKGSDAASSYRNQPGSNTPAKQRAFCLKASYINTIINENLIGEKCKSIVTSKEILHFTFENVIDSKLSRFYGKSESELFEIFKISQSSKNKFNLLAAVMLNIRGDINKTSEFQKAGIQLKTIRVEANNSIEQHMSFPRFDYCEIVKENWETSEINNQFSTKKFLFLIFKKKQNKYYFEKIVFWNMPLVDIENYVRPIWEKTVACIKNGNIVRKISSSKFYTNFPGSSINGVCHVRPHDIKSISNNNHRGMLLPTPDKLTGLTSYTRYCFWLDKNYIQKIIK